MTTDKIQEKIRKLLALADNNPSVEEAANAFAAAQRLATLHALDLDDLATGDEHGTADAMPEPREVEKVQQRRIVRWKKVVLWQLRIIGSLARSNGCKHFYSSGYGGVTVYGQPSDIATVQYLYDMIAAQLDKLTRTAVRHYGITLKASYDNVRDAVEMGEDTPRSYGRAFRLGAVGTISNRLRTQRDEIRETRTAIEAARQLALAGGNAAPAQAALVRTNGALARVERAEEYVGRVREEVTKFESGLGLGSGRGFSEGGGSSGGYAAGRAAGAGVSLGGSARGALKGGE